MCPPLRSRFPAGRTGASSSAIDCSADLTAQRQAPHPLGCRGFRRAGPSRRLSDRANAHGQTVWRRPILRRLVVRGRRASLQAMRGRRSNQDGFSPRSAAGGHTAGAELRVLQIEILSMLGHPTSPRATSIGFDRNSGLGGSCTSQPSAWPGSRRNSPSPCFAWSSPPSSGPGRPQGRRRFAGCGGSPAMPSPHRGAARFRPSSCRAQPGQAPKRWAPPVAGPVQPFIGPAIAGQANRPESVGSSHRKLVRPW